MIPTIEGFDHVHVHVADRAAAERWYARVLGFERTHHLQAWAADGGPLTLQDRSNTMHLALFERAPRPCHSTVAMRVSASAFCAWRRHLAVTLPGQVTEEDHGLSLSLYLRDPDGNPYEITTYEVAQAHDAASTLPASPALRVQRLQAHDAPAYRVLMLEAYEQAADAFTSTAEERAREPLAWWETRIAARDGSSACFAAFDGDHLVGTVALEYANKPKTRHAALVLGMYVQARARRQGAGRLLMRAAFEEARQRPGLHQLRLTVTEGNGPAIALYESMGFRRWGVEPQAILTPTGYKGKVHMALALQASPSSVASDT